MWSASMIRRLPEAMVFFEVILMLARPKVSPVPTVVLSTLMIALPAPLMKVSFCAAASDWDWYLGK